MLVAPLLGQRHLEGIACNPSIESVETAPQQSRAERRWCACFCVWCITQTESWKAWMAGLDPQRGPTDWQSCQV